MGCHVAPFLVGKICYGVCGVRTPDLPTECKVLAKAAQLVHQALVLNHYTVKFYLNAFVVIRAGPSWGLAPALDFVHTFPYDHTYETFCASLVFKWSVLSPWRTRHLSSSHATLLKEPPFCTGTWPHGPPCAQHLRLWGLSSLTVRQIHTFCGHVRVLGLGMETPRSQVRHTEV
jgi:hypothetical protein